MTMPRRDLLSKVLLNHKEWLEKRGLPRANFSSCGLVAVNLDKADLRCADLNKQVMAFSTFRGANLHDAMIKDARLTQTCFLGAYLNFADLTGTDLYEADFHRASMIKTILRLTDLTGADFSYANLTGADFTDADLTGVKWVGANVSYANFSGATFDRDKLMATAEITLHAIIPTSLPPVDNT